MIYDFLFETKDEKILDEIMKKVDKMFPCLIVETRNEKIAFILKSEDVILRVEKRPDVTGSFCFVLKGKSRDVLSVLCSVILPFVQKKKVSIINVYVYTGA